jgi:ribosomal protein L34
LGLQGVRKFSERVDTSNGREILCSSKRRRLP